ncbi:hypothetical protein [Thalassolituus sp. UBA3500]|uniref:hypothetical protein n=1 Tax=Thalassolituus sp. UBA3500 TaxID=1947664 RepID=UPI000C0D86C3|nr:hypothetical protein [Thalassolituus sp. UBA3500]MBN57041.1 hypothetical protein [Oceanospirillaceae bacterium]|tara:strand:- start:18921 stop:19364 length:444 start_codon:yes stop_codon:yes gene_type:complete
MKVLLIEKPLMKMEGLHSEFEGMPWKLFFISIPMLFIGILLMPFSKLFMIPALVVVCILLPSSMAVAAISRHYEDDSPNYRAARSRIYAFLHTAWVVGVYGWFSLWGGRIFRNYVEPIFVKYHLTKPASLDALCAPLLAGVREQDEY